MKGIKNKIIVSTFMIGLSITSANCMIFGCGAMYSKEGTHNSSDVHTVSTLTFILKISKLLTIFYIM